jgi:hypothetical protein
MKRSSITSLFFSLCVAMQFGCDGDSKPGIIDEDDPRLDPDSDIADVSFADDVAPIFERRGCVTCHDGNGIGKDLGGLHLNGAPDKMHKELVTEISANHGVVRVNLESPEQSLMLTLPSAEEPPDAHPVSTFASAEDEDYQLIYVWIAEGALKN